MGRIVREKVAGSQANKLAREMEADPKKVKLKFRLMTRANSSLRSLNRWNLNLRTACGSKNCLSSITALCSLSSLFLNPAPPPRKQKSLTLKKEVGQKLIKL